MFSERPSPLTLAEGSPSPPARPIPPPAIRAMERMGDYITARWRLVNHDEHAFVDIACRALARHPILGLDLEEFGAWAMSAEQLPAQMDLDSGFGDPPFTGYSGEGFHISLLFWLDGTTSIHRHMFSGAFQVVLGASLHTTFTFAPERRVNSRLLLGRLAFAGAELLERGAVRAIPAGDGLIHSAFHLDRPSVTVVVRTKTDDDARPQYDYLPPGIAIDGSYGTRTFRKRLQLLRMLRSLDQPAFNRSLRLMLASSSLETVCRLLLHPDLMGSAAGRDHLANGTQGFAEAQPWVQAAGERALRSHTLCTWRRVLTSPDQRFFVALLLTVPSGAQLRELVRQRYQREPAEVLMAWVREFIDLQTGMDLVQPIVDLPLDQSDLTLLHRCLSEAQAGDHRPGSGPERPPLASLEGHPRAEAFRRSLLLRALLW